MDIETTNIAADINDLVTDDTIKIMVAPVEITQHRDGTVSIRTSAINAERIHRAVMITKGHYPKATVSYRIFGRLGRLLRNAGIDKGIW